MFYILGSDGSRLGPIEAEAIRHGIGQGRLTAQTQVQAEGAADWQPLAALPEFAEALRAGALPPRLPGAGPSVGAGTDRPRRRTSGAAIAALVLGAIGPCTIGLTALAGIVVGIVALIRIGRSKGQLTGKGLAITGLCLSGLVLLVLPIALGLLLPALARGNFQQHRTATCVQHIQNVALALRLAAEANDGKFPAAANWCEAALPNLQGADLLKCPQRSSLRCGFAYNRNVAGRTTSSVPPDTVLLIESDRGWNAGAGPEDPVPRSPHKGVYSVAFADGSVREVDPGGLPALRWEP